MSSDPIIARALLIDMDGTLVDSHAAVERCWRRWAAEHDLDPAEVLPTVHGRQAYRTMADWLPDRPVEENYADNEAMLAAEIADVDGVVPIAGAGEFLAAIAGVPHALVTSADVALTTARMGAAGLPIPAARVTAEDVRASKPDPEGFLRAASVLGMPPARCVVLEDSDAGIRAARAAGMRVIGVGQRAAEIGADLLVADLTHLQVVVRGPAEVALSAR